MKKNILGGKDKTCDRCGKRMVFIKVKGIGVVSQCSCGNTVSGRMKDEVKIYTYDFEEEK